MNVNINNSSHKFDFEYNQNVDSNTTKQLERINATHLMPNTNGPHSKIINYNSEMISTIYKPDVRDYHTTKSNVNNSQVGTTNMAYVATSNFSLNNLNNYPTNNEFSIINQMNQNYSYNEKELM